MSGVVSDPGEDAPVWGHLFEGRCQGGHCPVTYRHPIAVVAEMQ